MSPEVLHTLQAVAVHLTGLLVAAVMVLGSATLFGRRRMVPALAGLVVLAAGLAAAATSVISLLDLAGYRVL